MGLVVRSCHFDVTACAEARRLEKEVTLIGGKLIGGIELSKMQNVTLSCEKMRNGRDDIELQKKGKVTLICEKKVAKCRSL